jgi:hypothetical protein
LDVKNRFTESTFFFVKALIRRLRTEQLAISNQQSAKTKANPERERRQCGENSLRRHGD